MTRYNKNIYPVIFNKREKIIASSRLFILSAKNNPWWKELRLPLEEYVDTVVTLAWLINYVYVRQVLRNKQRGDRLLPNSHTRYSSSTVETVAGSGMELNFVFQPSKSSSLKRKFILEFRFERQKEKRKKGSKRVKWSLESFERFQGEIFYFERIFFEFERIYNSRRLQTNFTSRIFLLFYQASI